MATVTVKLDEKLKEEAFATLKKLNITPSEAIRLVLQYIVENQSLPIQKNKVTLNNEIDDEDDLQLIEIVRERLKNPQKGIKVTLDDL